MPLPKQLEQSDSDLLVLSVAEAVPQTSVSAVTYTLPSKTALTSLVMSQQYTS